MSLLTFISQILTLIVIIIAAIFLVNYTSKALTEWKIAEDGLSLIWLGQFAFQHKQDRSIKWGEIKSYKYKVDSFARYDMFELKLHNGNKLRIYHSTTRRRDFEEFINCFEENIFKFNQRLEITREIIREKTFFETRPGRIIFIVLLIIGFTLGIIFTKIFSNKK